MYRWCNWTGGVGADAVHGAYGGSSRGGGAVGGNALMGFRGLPRRGGVRVLLVGVALGLLVLPGQECRAPVQEGVKIAPIGGQNSTILMCTIHVQ